MQPREEATREALDTFRVMSWLQQRWGERCCGRFVVSFTQAPAHLAAVRALARLAVGDSPLRLDVVPLLETGADLRAAVPTLDAWMALRGTQQWLEARGRGVEVMLGYSDSAKHVGPATATLTSCAPRGPRWPGRCAMTSHSPCSTGAAVPSAAAAAPAPGDAGQAPGSVAGRLKVTEQGEVMFARYGDTTLAQRHLERVTTAVLLAYTPARPH